VLPHLLLLFPLLDHTRNVFHSMKLLAVLEVVALRQASQASEQRMQPT
jgi:hypothetical protein